MADFVIVVCFVFCLLTVNCLGISFLLKLQKGSGDIFDSGRKVMDSHMKIRFIAFGYLPPFTIYKIVVDSLLKSFSQVVDTLLKGFACSLHH